MDTDTPRTDAEVQRTARISATSGSEQAWEDMCYVAKELERELIASAERVQVLEAALQRIHDMAERPMCTCGVPTGTAAIKAVARQALGSGK